MELGQEQLDRLELLTLEGAYSALFDSRDAVAWSQLFTEDGSYEAAGFARAPGEPLAVGRQALAQLCEAFEADVVHILGVPHLTIGDDEAVGRVSSASIVTGEGSDARLQRMTYGYYDVRYRRTADGWRIHRRVSYALVRSEEHQGPAVGPVPRLGT